MWIVDVGQGQDDPKSPSSARAVHDSILDRVGTFNEELDLVLLAKLLYGLTLSLEWLLAGLLDLFLCWSHCMGPLLRELDLKSAKPEIGPNTRESLVTVVT